MSSVITIEVVLAAGTAYEAYQSGKTASTARSMAESTAGKQNYYNDLLKTLMSNPDSFFNTAVFQSAQNQGLQAAERKMNSAGYKDSGNLLSALMAQGQGFAAQQLSDQEKILAGISGVSSASSPGELLGASTDAQALSDQQWNKLVGQLAFMSGGQKSSLGGGTSYGGGSVIGGATGAGGSWYGGSGIGGGSGSTDAHSPWS